MAEAAAAQNNNISEDEADDLEVRPYSQVKL